MAAALLADSNALLRLIVPNALLLQTTQLMQARLGGLVGREVRHVPFSRRTPTSEAMVQSYYNHHDEIKCSAGIMMAIPEHILSFQLSGLQKLSDGRLAEAQEMIRVQGWMQQHCRQILDESDFTLAVRTQLIYPSGSRITVDGHPHRWEVTEVLLSTLQGLLRDLQSKYPRSIEVIYRQQGGFPVIYLPRSDVEDALIEQIVSEIVDGRTSILDTQNYTRHEIFAIRDFISLPTITQESANKLSLLFSERPIDLKIAYLLRGLLAHRILLTTLKKRWNVQYGLHYQREPIAVPFHAKGVPSDNAEWGHPDVAILFTCLAFYLEGISVTQLGQCLNLLVKSDDPSSEFERWTQWSTSMPGFLRDWNLINTDDEMQLEKLWRHLRLNVTVIDYFMNHFVFPKHAKQFQIKQQASGWDIPLSNRLGQGSSNSTQHLTTGFSGTNDNRSLLPLNIAQQDLPGLSHTNAEVLHYLLQPRNREYAMIADREGKRLSEEDFLQSLYNRNIRVLIDAGAQILELTNRGVAKSWLEIDGRASAAVYFNENNKAMVLYRKGRELPLLATPFVDDLAECLVYLDEAHTRGTDLKLPPNARGALTLGMGQTKDHTVQGKLETCFRY